MTGTITTQLAAPALWRHNTGTQPDISPAAYYSGGTAQPAAAAPTDEQIAAAVRPLYADDTAASMGLPDDIRTVRAVLGSRPATAACSQCGMAGEHKLQCSARPDPRLVVGAVATQPAAAGGREAFEAWAASEGIDCTRADQDGTGMYRDEDARIAWGAWQARGGAS